MTRVHLNFHCVVSLLVSCLPAFSSSVGPKTETLQAWDNYIQRVKSRTIAVGGDRGFLWMDQDPQRAERVHRGEILAGSELGSGPEAVPHGLIHDWVGPVFIPGATLAQVFAVLEDYGQLTKAQAGRDRRGSGVQEPNGRGTDEETFRVRYAKSFCLVRKCWKANTRFDTFGSIASVGIPSRRARGSRKPLIRSNPANVRPAAMSLTATFAEVASSVKIRAKRRLGVRQTKRDRSQPRNSDFLSTARHHLEPRFLSMIERRCAWAYPARHARRGPFDLPLAGIGCDSGVSCSCTIKSFSGCC